jgi:hypothetical protein
MYNINQKLLLAEVDMSTMEIFCTMMRNWSLDYPVANINTEVSCLSDSKNVICIQTIPLNRSSIMTPSLIVVSIIPCT